MSDDARQESVIKRALLRGLLRLADIWERYRHWRHSCPICGRMMTAIVPVGRVCMNRGCENYRGNKVRGKMLAGGDSSE